MRLRHLCLSLLPLLGAGSAPKQKAEPAILAGLDSVVLERTPCFGTCPAYRLVIARGGLVHFQSRDGQQPAIDARVTAAVSVLDTIASRAVQLGFFDLPDDVQKDPVLCKDRATDHPTIILGLFGQRSKRVIYYTGCYTVCCEHSRAARLTDLARLATAIDSMARSSRWVRPGRGFLK